MNLLIKVFKKFEKTSGIHDNKDLNLIYDKYIRKADSVLGQGAEYGRVVSELFKRDYMGEISCVERDKRCCQLLRTEYSDSINVYQSNILTASPKVTFGVILWLWVGFAEFSKEEQPNN